MTLAEIIRDAPAGQLARTYLGWQIAPYEDEKEGYKLPRPEEQATASRAEGKREVDPEKASEDSSDEEKKGNSVNGKPAGPEPQGDRDIERIATEREPQHPPQPDFNEVGFSPTDLDNPHNWSTGKKVFVFSQICLLTFSSEHTLTLGIYQR